MSVKEKFALIGKFIFQITLLKQLERACNSSWWSTALQTAKKLNSSN